MYSFNIYMVYAIMLVQIYNTYISFFLEIFEESIIRDHNTDLLTAIINSHTRHY